MRRTRRARAFTMIELIVVIVILGILAGIAIVGYGAVTDKAKDSALDQSVQSFDREYKALLAFAITGETVETRLVNMAATDLPAGVTVNYRDTAGTGKVAATASTTAAAVFDTPAKVEFVSGSKSVCLTLATTSTAAISKASGACVVATM